MQEIEVTRRFQQKALEGARVLSFVGAGAYRHYIPAPVSLRSNFFTPGEESEKSSRSQVSNSLIESLSDLNGMDASYFAGSDLIAALVKACVIGLKFPRKNRANRILIASTVNPFYRKAIRTWLKPRGIDPDLVHYDDSIGAVGLDQLKNENKKTADVLVIQYPNFFGVLEPIDEIAVWARKQGITLISIVNPLALGALKPPGRWGKQGADIAVYDLQTLGLPVCFAGAVPGFISIKKRLIEKFEVAAKSLDNTRNLQPATEWMHARAEAYLSFVGNNGIARIAQQCALNLVNLESRLLEIPQLSVRFSGDRFHESVVKFDQLDLSAVLSLCTGHGIQIGYPLEQEYPELGQCVMFNATENHLPEDINAVVGKLKKAVEIQSKASCPVTR